MKSALAATSADYRCGTGFTTRNALRQSDQTPGLGTARGLGWLVQPADLLAPLSLSAYGHAGFTGTSLVIDPDRDLVAVLLTNRVYAGRMHEGIDELRLELHRLLAGMAA